MLEHEADVALLGRELGGVDALDLDRAGVGVLEPGDDAQQGRLAAAARAEQRGELPAGMLTDDVVEGDEVAEALADVGSRCSSAAPPGRMIETMTMQATDTRASRNAVA